MDIKDFEIKTLGTCHTKSPLVLSKVHNDGIFDYISDDERILYEVDSKSFQRCIDQKTVPMSFEKAGPREKLFFDPTKTKAAIVTCGGLCPGINAVIRSLVMELHYRYHVKNTVGIQFGYSGFISDYGFPFIELTPDTVDDIHTKGGSILGSSRGNQDVKIIVDVLENNNINMLFCVGGDGTLKGAHDIQQEIEKRNLKISVAGVPKTIDNDINYIQKSFGFETAFTTASSIIRDAHNEAKGYYNGVVIIKLMGRDSGFISAKAALAMPEVNFVLIPELDFDLEGEKGFLNVLKERILKSKHALIVVAEGAGQKFFEKNTTQKDLSGNVLHKDIGIFIKDTIVDYFKQENVPISMKYIDPSYIIRSTAANANDQIFCSQLAQNAVHGTMAGKTDFVVGIWNNLFTYLPIPLATRERKKINIEGELWWGVLEATGQPVSMKNS